MTLRDDKLGQTWLLPVSVLDLIPKDHMCHFVAGVVNNIDISEKDDRYMFTPGNPAYSRRMLLRLVIMASVDAVWSSRNMAKLARDNVVYMYHSGNDKPDFRTICNYKKECKELIEKAFKTTVVVATASTTCSLIISLPPRVISISDYAQDWEMAINGITTCLRKLGELRGGR